MRPNGGRDRDGQFVWSIKSPPPQGQYDRVEWPVIKEEAMRGSTAGIDDGLQALSSKHYQLLTFLDKFLSISIITPLVVAYWRGTWRGTDVLVYSDDGKKSAMVSMLIGTLGSLLFTLCQSQIMNKIHSHINPVKYYLITRLYTASFGIVCVNQFRGAWMFLDLHTSCDVVTVTIITVSSIFILFITKTLRNLSAPPFAVTIDRYEDYFTVPTFFKYVSTEYKLN